MLVFDAARPEFTQDIIHVDIFLGFVFVPAGELHHKGVDGPFGAPVP
jgi:hypothetical protein